MRRLFPDLDIEDVSRFEPLQDELELTMADFVRLMVAVTEQTGVVVPKREYPLVSTLDDLEHYLASRLVLDSRPSVAVGRKRRKRRDGRRSATATRR